MTLAFSATMPMASAYISSFALIFPKLPLPCFPSSSLSFPSIFKSKIPVKIPRLRSSINPQRVAVSKLAEFDVPLLGRDLESNDSLPPAGLEYKEELRCPPGLRQYETMVVLRPDMSEDERLAFIQKYEGLRGAGGGMYVEVLNKGVLPLAYSIKKKNRAGESNTYLDGISLVFTYFTKPESVAILGETLLTDDDVVRSSSVKIRRRKY